MGGLGYRSLGCGGLGCGSLGCGSLGCVLVPQSFNLSSIIMLSVLSTEAGTFGVTVGLCSPIIPRLVTNCNDVIYFPRNRL